MPEQLLRRAAVLSFLLCLFTGETRADDWDNCKWEKLETGIVGCTAIIDGGKGTPENMALAYHLRGLSYVNKSKFDQAIADFSHSIKLNPNVAETYYN